MKTKAIRNRFVLLISLCALVAAGPIGCGGGTKVVSLTDPGLFVATSYRWGNHFRSRLSRLRVFSQTGSRLVSK